MRKRTYLMILFLIIPVSIQLFGIPYLGIKFTNHDIEFDYVYNWNLRGTGGWYEGYSEEFRANGRYTIDFNGNVANASAYVKWHFISRLYGYKEDEYGSEETYVFSYSLTDGAYLTGEDQDYNITGMNVWFHIPGGVTGTSYSLLDSTYEVIGPSTIWVGHLMPFNGVKLHDSGVYARDDVYGQFSAEYTVDNFFTRDGYLIGEIYSEVNDGLDADTGYPSTFKLTSYVFITSSSYIRPFNFGIYFIAYWVHLVFFYILFYIVYERLRWKPIVMVREPSTKTVIIERNLPNNLEFSISSAYSEIIPTFLVRGKSYGKRIISAHNENKIKGIGFIEPNGKIGTFYGKYSAEMIEYSKVKYAFTEISRVSGFKVIEKYDVFQIDDLKGLDLSYDATLIKPATKRDLPEITRMIAYEDYGKKSKKYAKWVIKAVQNDITVLAITSPQESWTREIMQQIYRRNYPKPQFLLNEIIIGTGFATPGENSGWLYGLYVHPAFRNQGIGNNLVKARLSALKELGCKNAITEIADWNGPAKRIYSQLNAQLVGDITLIGKKMPKVKVRRY